MLHKCNRPIYIALLFLLTLFLLCDYIPALHFFTACIPKVYKTYVISSAQLSARENFFLKNTTSGKRFITSLPACSIYPLCHQNLFLSRPMGSNELIASDFSAQKHIFLQKICTYHKKTLPLQGKNADNRKNTP